jgi:phosphosulfolactate synthase
MSNRQGESGPVIEAMSFLEIVEREAKPRRTGLTLVRDPGYGVKHLDGLLQTAAPFVDFIKYRNLTPRLWSESTFKAKNDLIKSYNIETLTGGIYGELAFLQGKWDQALDYLVEIGLTAFELSENYVTFEPRVKARMLKRLTDAGLIILYEWGRKKPEHPFDPGQTADDIRLVLDSGARYVILEEGEIDAVLGVDGSSPEAHRLRKLFDLVGFREIIRETTRPRQQAWLLRNFGINVNLGPNLLLDEVFWLESNRRGLSRTVEFFALDKWLEKAGIAKHGE